jgi:hypothetical protein
MKINLHFIPNFDFGNKKWREKLESSDMKKIFIPLQYSPEATVDYWCENDYLVNYEESIAKYIDKLSKDFIVLIKEHPAVVGHRSPKNYKKIINQKNKNIVICPASVNSNECIINS